MTQTKVAGRTALTRDRGAVRTHSFAVTDDHIATLDALTLKLDGSRSEHVRRALDVYFKLVGVAPTT